MLDQHLGAWHVTIIRNTVHGSSYRSSMLQLTCLILYTVALMVRAAAARLNARGIFAEVILR
jgi:hypothetical protein